MQWTLRQLVVVGMMGVLVSHVAVVEAEVAERTPAAGREAAALATTVDRVVQAAEVQEATTTETPATDRADPVVRGEGEMAVLGVAVETPRTVVTEAGEQSATSRVADSDVVAAATTEHHRLRLVVLSQLSLPKRCSFSASFRTAFACWRHNALLPALFGDWVTVSIVQQAIPSANAAMIADLAAPNLLSAGRASAKACAVAAKTTRPAAATTLVAVATLAEDLIEMSLAEERELLMTGTRGSRAFPSDAGASLGVTSTRRSECMSGGRQNRSCSHIGAAPSSRARRVGNGARTLEKKGLRISVCEIEK